MHRKIHEDSQLKFFLFSAAAGTVIGAATALLAAPKTGKKLRKDLYDTYENITEQGQEFFQDAVDKGQYAAKAAGQYMDDIKEAAKNLVSYAPEASNSNINLLVGALAGGCIGAAAVFWLSPKAEEESFTQKIKEASRTARESLNSVDWVDTARDVIETIYNKVNSNHHNGSTVEGYKGQSKIQDALELANVGLRLWDNIKKRS